MFSTLVRGRIVKLHWFLFSTLEHLNNMTVV
uniref:Uncharacterized protein n=1 Tax=Anguilla anguilla TaxID=7936 RepID=A0A0E9SPV7_ANGAN